MAPLTAAERVARASLRASMIPSGTYIVPAGSPPLNENGSAHHTQPAPHPHQWQQPPPHPQQVQQPTPQAHYSASQLGPLSYQGQSESQAQFKAGDRQPSPVQQPQQTQAEPNRVQPEAQQTHPLSIPGQATSPSTSDLPNPTSAASSLSFHSPQATPSLQDLPHSPPVLSPKPSPSPPVPPFARRASQVENWPGVSNTSSFTSTPPTPPPHDDPKSVHRQPTRRATANSYISEEFAGTQLYSGFDRDGDVLIQCTEDGKKTGFLVNSTPLRRVSTTFAAAMTYHPSQGKLAIKVTESSYEMSLLLHAIVYGTTHPAFNALSVNDYLLLLDLYDKYAIVPFLRNMLVHSINSRVSDFSRTLAHTGVDRSQVEAYLSLAHICRSDKLWAAGLQYANRWQELVRPWNSSQTNMDGEIFDILLALEGVKGPGEGFAALRVVYSDGKSGVSVGRLKERVLFSVLSE